MKINVKQAIIRAERSRQKGAFSDAIRHAKPVFLKDDQNYDALLILALSYLGSNNYSSALLYAQKIRECYPNHPNGAMVASVALMGMRQNTAAVEVLESQLELDPGNKALMFNLHSAYGGLENHSKALTVALDTVGLFPTDSDAYNNLGASLSNIGRRGDAVIAFQTAVDLNPRNLTARLNLIHTKFKGEENDAELVRALEAIKAEIRGTDLPQKRTMTGAIHNGAFAYFRLGQLTKGWESLEAGLSPEIDSNRGRKPNRTFKAPRWNGEPLKGRRLMVWREQGLGDEIMFGSMLSELSNQDGEIVIECEPRLVEILQNSFPTYEIRSELYRGIYPFDSPKEDFDFQIPIASLGGIYRKTIDAFHGGPYIKPLLEQVSDFSARLKMFREQGKVLVGLCWRSGVVSPTRGANYTLIEDWERLLRNDRVVVVNLQYGKCEEEVVAVEKNLGVTILRWPDVSLQNDQSKLAAIISSLDYVFSIGSAVAQLAGAVGTPTAMVALKPTWTSFGTDHYPFFSSIELFCGHQENILDAVEKSIKSFEDRFFRPETLR
jgi:tetratricopeptide (TPR) repeat protein